MNLKQLLRAYEVIINAISNTDDPRAQNILENELREIVSGDEL